MAFFGDYHTHTVYSDGETKIRQNLEQARERGLKEVAITDHGFRDMRSLRPNTFLQQKALINSLREEFSDLTIYQGIEADLIGVDGILDLTEDQLADKEVLNFGWHGFAKANSIADWRKLYLNAFKTYIAIEPTKAEVARNTNAVISVIKKYPVDTFVHINYRFRVNCIEVAQACADYGTYVEINNKHLRNIGHELFEELLQKTPAIFIANTDAHIYSQLGNFTKIEAFLAQHDVPEDRICNLNKIPSFPRREARLKL